MFKEITKRLYFTRVFLLLDEAQHLAVSESFTGLKASLRSALDTTEVVAPGQLFNLLTESSMTNVTRLLNDPKDDVPGNKREKL